MSRIKDADAIVTMRNGNPCFSYPQDKEIRKRPYSFGYLSVSKNGPYGAGGWEIQIASPDRKGLLEPNTPKSCIEYGVLNPGTEVIKAAQSLQFDTPYNVYIRVSARDNGVLYMWQFQSDFCISSNEKGVRILVGADWDDKAGGWKCLKPGESPKRGFWERLFGE
ncbi:MAG: hypothetical protein ACYDGO_08975 [Smithellaceae bacterium]